MPGNSSYRMYRAGLIMLAVQALLVVIGLVVIVKVIRRVR